MPIGAEIDKSALRAGLHMPLSAWRGGFELRILTATPTAPRIWIEDLPSADYLASLSNDDPYAIHEDEVPEEQKRVVMVSFCPQPPAPHEQQQRPRAQGGA